MIGDETIAEDPETLVAFLTEKGHPALAMDPMMYSRKGNECSHSFWELTLSFELRRKAVANSESQEKFRVCNLRKHEMLRRERGFVNISGLINQRVEMCTC